MFTSFLANSCSCLYRGMALVYLPFTRAGIQGFCVNPLYLFRERVKKIRLFFAANKTFLRKSGQNALFGCSMGRGGNTGGYERGQRPNPRRTQNMCSGTMDKSIGCAILQIACGRATQRCSASFSRRSFASSCSLSNSRIRSILALAVSSSFISSRAFR